MPERKCIACGAPGGSGGYCYACNLPNVVADVDLRGSADGEIEPEGPPRRRSRPRPRDVTRAGELSPRLVIGGGRALLARALGEIEASTPALLYGPPGQGKTTDAMLLACDVVAAVRPVAPRARALLVTGEMSDDQIARYARRLEVRPGMLDVLRADALEDVGELAAHYRCIVLDSLGALAAAGEPAGHPRAVARLVQWARARAAEGRVVVILGRTDKRGRLAGRLASAFDVDVVARLERRALTIEKSRVGMVHRRIANEHTRATSRAARAPRRESVTAVEVPTRPPASPSSDRGALPPHPIRGARRAR